MVHTKQEAIKRCKELLGLSETDEAIAILESILEDADDKTILIKSQWSKIKQQDRDGILTHVEYNREHQKVNQAILKTLNEFISNSKNLKHKIEERPAVIQTPPEQKSENEYRKIFSKTNFLILLFSLLVISAIGFFILVPDEKENKEASASNLNGINYEYFHEGNAHYGGEDFDQAIRSYEKFIAQYNSDSFSRTQISEDSSYCSALISVMMLKYNQIISASLDYSESGIDKHYEDFEYYFCDEYSKSPKAIMEYLRSKNYIAN